MVTISFCVLYGSALFLAFPAETANAPSARAIVEAAVAAQGGKDRLKLLTRYRLRTEGEVYQDGERVGYTAETWADVSDRCRSRITLVGGVRPTFTKVLNQDSAWKSANGTVKEMTKEELSWFKRNQYTNRVTTLYPLLEDPSFTLSYLGEQVINGRPALEVKVSSKGQADLFLYFDKQSHLLVKHKESFDPPADGFTLAEEYYGRYEEFGGVTIARVRELYADQRKHRVMRVVEFEPLSSIDGSMFQRPDP